MAPTSVSRRSGRSDRSGTPRRRRAAAPDNFVIKAAEWWRNKRIGDQVKLLLEGDRDKSKPGAALGLRLEVLEQVKRSGEADENGSRFYHFAEPVDGLAGLKAQRAASPSFDPEKADEIVDGLGSEVRRKCSRVVLELEPDKHDEVERVLREAGVYEDCVASREEVIDQDLVLAYHATHREVLTAKMVDEMTPLQERWSLIPIPASE